MERPCVKLRSAGGSVFVEQRLTLMSHAPISIYSIVPLCVMQAPGGLSNCAGMKCGRSVLTCRSAHVLVHEMAASEVALCCNTPEVKAASVHPPQFITNWFHSFSTLLVKDVVEKYCRLTFLTISQHIHHVSIYSVDVGRQPPCEKQGRELSCNLRWTAGKSKPASKDR